MASFVIDTNVIMYGVEPSDSSNIYGNTPLTILTRFIESENAKIAVDIDPSEESESGSKILDEYLRNLKQSDSGGLVPHLKKIIQRDMNAKGQNKLIKWIFPIDRTKVEEFEEDGFDTSDLIFLRIGPNSSESIIISADDRSLVDEEFRRRAENKFDIDILEPDKVPDKLNSFVG